MSLNNTVDKDMGLNVIIYFFPFLYYGIKQISPFTPDLAKNVRTSHKCLSGPYSTPQKGGGADDIFLILWYTAFAYIYTPE